MKQKNINYLLLRKAIGSSTPEENKKIEEWIKSDAKHRAQYDALMNEDDLLDRMNLYHLLDEDSAWNEFYQKTFKSQRTIKLRLYWCAASIVMLLSFSALMFLYVQHSQPLLISKVEKLQIERSVEAGNTGAIFMIQENKKVNVPARVQKKVAEGTPMPKEFFEQDVTVKTEYGKEFWMTLDDGTRVHLNYNTTLKYPAHFQEGNRTVYLEGEAYFDVKHQDGRPFYVRTTNGVVKDYGTAFNVNTNGNQTMVLLVEGKVSVIPNEGDEVPLEIGQMATMTSEEGVLNIEKVNIDLYTSWNTGMYVFDACPMTDLMQVLSCWYEKGVIFKDEEARNVEFTGRLDKYNDLEGTLNAIEFITKREIYVERDHIIIK